MLKSVLTILLSLSLAPSGLSQSIDALKKKYILDDLSIYIENPSSTDNNPERYTADNKVYKPNRKFIFDYYIMKGKDTFQIITPQVTDFKSDFQRIWNLTPKSTRHTDKVETISLTVLPGITNTNQTTLKYEYQYSFEPRNNTFSSTSGVIENEMNTWMHPHRDKYFMILEINPFPFIQQPFKIGNKWTWALDIGDNWSDPRWKKWTGPIKNNYAYEIVGKEILKTKIGVLDCWVVMGTATSSIGSTGLISYYSETHGFVKLDYINIDKSRLTIEIKEIR